MKRFSRWMMLFAVAALLAVRPAKGQAVPAELAPFMEDTTLGVVEVDVTKVGAQQLANRVLKFMKTGGMPAADIADAENNMKEGIAFAGNWQAEFSKAGGSKLYIVVAFTQKSVIAYSVIPLQANSDEAALTGIARQAAEGMNGDVKKVKNVLVVGPQPMVRAATFAAAAEQPVIRNDIGAALAAAGEGAVRVAFAPPLQLKGAVAMGQPKLPQELGGGPTSALTDAFRYASLSLALPSAKSDQINLKLAIQASDAAGAAKLKSVADKVIGLAKQSMTEQADRNFGPDGIAGLLDLQVAGDKLTWELTDAKIEAAAKPAIGAAMAAREQANRIKSASNMRQITLACIIYANEHKDVLPMKIPDDIKEELNGQAGLVWTNPRSDLHPPYVYVRPAAGKIGLVKNASETVLLYEAYTNFGQGINVAFVDGHVEWIADEAKFKALLQNK